MISTIRTWRLAMLLALVALAATPAFAQPCNELDSGGERPQYMIDRIPECGGVAPVIPEQPQFGSGSLTTLFAANNGFAGNTFDLEPIGGADLTITGFDINIDSPGSSNDVTIYWRLGSAVGVENDPLEWTLLGTETGVISAGPDNPTPVNIGGLTMTPGQVYGIYFDLTSYPSSVVGYTNGGPTVFSNADLQLTTNTGQSSPAFNGSFFPRQWNGTVYYDIADPEIPTVEIPTLGMVGLGVLLLGLGGAGFAILRRRRKA